MRAILALVVLTIPAGFAQTKVVGNAAASVVVNSSDPATCSVGQIEFNSGGSAMKVCTATNTWSSVGGGGTWGSITGTLSGQSDLQSALDAKVPTTTTVNGHALSSNVTVSKSDVGLGSVPNTDATALNGAKVSKLRKSDDSGDALTCDASGICTIGTTLANLVATATVPTVALVATGTGNLTNGDHSWLITYVTAFGESGPGAVSAALTVDDTHKQVSITSIPVSADARVVSKNIYQTKATGKAHGSGNTCSTSAPCTATDFRNYWLVANIANATTSYTANTDDSSLTGTTPPFDSTGGQVLIQSTLVGQYGSFPNGFYSPNLIINRNGGLYIDTVGVSTSGPERDLVAHFCCGNSSAANNTFFGIKTGNTSLTGHQNTGYGWSALKSLTSGSSNTAIGNESLYSLTTGSTNIAVGPKTLRNNTASGGNVAIGYSSMSDADIGVDNVGVGLLTLFQAASSAHRNTAIGTSSCANVTAGESNVCLGGVLFPGTTFTGPVVPGTLSNTIAIGASTEVSASNTAVIGNGLITDVYLGSETPSAKLHAGGGSDGHATCWKGDHISYCTSAVGIDGTCTCN